MFKKILLVLLGAWGAAILMFLAIGLFASSHRDAQLTQIVDASPDWVWHYLTDVDGLPKRRPDIKRIEDLPSNGLRKWREITQKNRILTYEYVEVVPYQKIVLRLIDSTVGLRGIWTYRLQAKGFQTELTIEEHSELTHLLARATLAVTGKTTLLRQEFKLINEELRRLH